MLTALWNGKPRNAHKAGRHLLRRVSRVPIKHREVMFEYDPAGVHSITNIPAPWRDAKGNLFTESEIAEKYAYMGELVLDEAIGAIHHPTLVKAANIVGSTVIGPDNSEEMRIVVSNVCAMLYHNIMGLGGERPFQVSIDEVRSIRRG